MTNKLLIQKIKKLRQQTFMAFIKKKAHLGGSFSAIEILLSLYEKTLKKRISLF